MMANANKPKKRKYSDEKRTFKEEWKEGFAFISKQNKAFCLICCSSINNFKVGNLKRHHEKLHPEFSLQFPKNSEIRATKLKELEEAVTNQSNFMAKFVQENKSVNEASYKMAWNIARAKRPYVEGKFLKENLIDLINVLDPTNLKLLKLVNDIPTSRQTISRRISDISTDLVSQLTNDINDCVAFSLALDESTDITDQPQLAIFIRYVFQNALPREELLHLIALKESTRGVDIKQALDIVLKNVPKHKLVSVATDGAAAMVGKNLGLIGLLKKDENIPDFIPIHCIIHREHLVAKHFNFEHIFTPVVKIVNFIRTNAKNHRQFRNFIDELELETEVSDLSLYCIVRWLSTYNILNKFVMLLEPIIEFLEIKKQLYPQLREDAWIQDLMFFTDTLEHLHNLNLSLQGKNKNVTDFAQLIFSFQVKLQLFQKDISEKTLNHFPRLKKVTVDCDLKALDMYKTKLCSLFDDFQIRFADLKSLKPSFAFLLNPFGIDVIKNGFPLLKCILFETTKGELQLIELQADEGLKMLHVSANSINEFWKNVPSEKYGLLKIAACRLLSIFGSTYNVESLYSTMKYVKSQYRSVLTNEHLNELLRCAITNYEPNYKKLVSAFQVHNPSVSKE